MCVQGKMQDLLTVFLRLIWERMLLARTAFESCANAPTLCLHNPHDVHFDSVVSLTPCLTHLPLGLLQMIVLDEIRVTPALRQGVTPALPSDPGTAAGHYFGR